MFVILIALAKVLFLKISKLVIAVYLVAKLKLQMLLVTGSLVQD